VILHKEYTYVTVNAGRHTIIIVLILKVLLVNGGAGAFWIQNDRLPYDRQRILQPILGLSTFIEMEMDHTQDILGHLW